MMSSSKLAWSKRIFWELQLWIHTLRGAFSSIRANIFSLSSKHHHGQLAKGFHSENRNCGYVQKFNLCNKILLKWKWIALAWNAMEVFRKISFVYISIGRIFFIHWFDQISKLKLGNICMLHEIISETINNTNDCLLKWCCSWEWNARIFMSLFISSVFYEMKLSAVWFFGFFGLFFGMLNIHSSSILVLLVYLRVKRQWQIDSNKNGLLCHWLFCFLFDLFVTASLIWHEIKMTRTQNVLPATVYLTGIK